MADKKTITMLFGPYSDIRKTVLGQIINIHTV